MKLPAKLQDALNVQIKNELQAHYNYLGMSAYFERTPYLGFAKWMRVQSTEEYGHASKLYDYMRERNAVIELQALAAPQKDYSPKPLEIFEVALKQEQG